jgi:hypothetical protein
MIGLRLSYMRLDFYSSRKSIGTMSRKLTKGLSHEQRQNLRYQALSSAIR